MIPHLVTQTHGMGVDSAGLYHLEAPGWITGVGGLLIIAAAIVTGALPTRRPRPQTTPAAPAAELAAAR